MEQQEHIQKLADEYYEEGRARFFDHKLEEAAMLVQNALRLYKKCDDMLKYATALNMLGVIYGATGTRRWRWIIWSKDLSVRSITS